MTARARCWTYFILTFQPPNSFTLYLYSHILPTFNYTSLNHTPTPFSCRRFLYYFKEIVFTLIPIPSSCFTSNGANHCHNLMLHYFSSNVLFRGIQSISVFIIRFRCVFTILYLSFVVSNGNGWLDQVSDVFLFFYLRKLCLFTLSFIFFL